MVMGFVSGGGKIHGKDRCGWCICRRRREVIVNVVAGDGGDVSRRVFVLGVVGMGVGYWIGGGNGKWEEAMGRVRIGGEDWEAAECPTETMVKDITQLPAAPERVFAVCEGGELWESFDGGMSWTKREDLNAPLRTIRFKGGEGWIAGRNLTLLYTNDSGRSWRTVTPPGNLPGDVGLATPTGRNSVELISTLGATFTSSDAGVSWKNNAKEIPTSMGDVFTGHLRTFSRDEAGNYIALTERGASFLTLKAGERNWCVRDRVQSSTRLLNAGFINHSVKNGIWLTDRSGSIFRSPRGKLDLGSKNLVRVELIRGLPSSGYGILDLDNKTPSELYAIAGSGTILHSTDAGDTWTQDPSVLIPGDTLRTIKYPFAFGKNGLILRHRPSS